MYINSLKINYSSEGSGKNLILLHGWGQSNEMWKNILPELAQKYRVITLDLPGFGRSTEPNTVWDTSDYSNFLHQFILKKNINNPIILGHSFGGRIALDYYKRNNIKKLILYSTNLCGGFRLFRFFNIILIKIFLYIAPNFLYSVHINFLHPKQYKNYSIVKTKRSEIMLQTYIQTHSIFSDNLDALVERSNILIVAGDKDGIIQKHSLPNSVVIVGSGHFSHITNKLDFLKKVTLFLDKNNSY